MTNHPSRSNTCRPREHLRMASHLYPDAWKQYDRFQQLRGKELDWPDWCYCPLSATYAIVSGGGDLDPTLVGDIARLGALAAWRVSQGVYRFDPALYAAIIDTPICQLPVDVLYYLPEWCVYIETNIRLSGTRIHGFFAHLEHDYTTGRPELRLVLDTEEETGPGLFGLPLHLTESTIDGALAAMLAESHRLAAIKPDITIAQSLTTSPEDFLREYIPLLTPMLNLILYICSANADLGGDKPEKPQPTRTKKGWKLFPPDAPRTWNVGVRIGAALRNAYMARQTEQPVGLTESGHVRPGPHVRRSHWHTYRVGEGRSKSTLKWLPPIPVNMDDPNSLPTTIHLVKGS